MLSFVSWLRKKKITPRFYCSYPLSRVFGPDVLFLTTGEPSGLAGAQLAPHMGSRCLIPIWIMKHFTVMDSFIKYVALVMVWILPVALQVLNIIIYILWFCLHPHLVIMLFLGQFLMSTQLLSIRNIQNVWISLFAKNTGKAISSLDWLWDGPLYNENKLTDIILNTMPLLIVQAYNNTAIGIWTTIAVLNFIVSFVLVIDLVSRYAYWVLIQGKSVNEVSSHVSVCFWFCLFELVSKNDKEKHTSLNWTNGSSSNSTSGGDGGVELKSTSPIHHTYELKLALDAIRAALKPTGGNEEALKQMLLLLYERKDHLDAMRAALQSSRDSGEQIKQTLLILLQLNYERKDLRISSVLDSEDVRKWLLKSGFKKTN